MKLSRPWKYRAFLLNGLILLLPIWYFYSAMSPQFPKEWPERRFGTLTAAPTPVDDGPAYASADGHRKDFSLRFCEGCVSRIRMAYLNAGPRPVMPDNLDGVLHGDRFSQHVHAPYPARPGADDRLWLTVQEWNGRVHQVWWPLSQ